MILHTCIDDNKKNTLYYSTVYYQFNLELGMSEQPSDEVDYTVINIEKFAIEVWVKSKSIIS